MSRVVLVTGVSRLVGGMTVRALAADPEIDRVIAVDTVPPLHGIGRADFVRADIRNPIIGKILSQERVDTVLHLGVIMTPKQAGGRTLQKEINVIGTMQLLAACQKADSLQRLVVKSSSSIYGSSPRDPAMFTEDMSARRNPTGGFGRDSVEVETYVRGLARRRPDIEVTMLRMANLVGPGLRTTFSEYFAMPALPVPLGYDGRFQVLHIDDAVRVLQRATVAPAAGTVNVAGDGMLTLRQAARLAGKPTVPVLPQAGGLVQQLGGLLGGNGAFDAEQMQFLQFGRGVDTTRMRTVLGFEPAATTREAFTAVFGARNPLLALGGSRV
ncbi:NAD-dependent epimerase/dehydratase family protein [Flexivirga sp. ID2601S]|uniref:NAD-dependent epimerase/dehydratase family protein n=1 Tax=Flexivirga aerilata TaxID=1656889 RepID=A0A849ABM7_9MICO|nr:NAD-dependent epimerase/dehydratase family protein [Flexivirga aerilata]NNG37925.1 NAD-dependent epimerase/dehydratase family protein [Flexivirga aerilata]